MVFIFESHPVQYKAPVYQRMQQLKPNAFEVIYVSDCSVRGYRDREFGEVVTWDTPLLSGYPHRVLHNERGTPLRGFRSLTGKGIYRLLQDERPRAMLFSQFLYEADLTAYLSCLALGIPIWIRYETQDEAFRRPPWKTALRGMLYRLIYRGVSHAFYPGDLSREHLLRHGIRPENMSFSPYCVISPAAALSGAARQERRDALRSQLGVTPNETMVLFSGKLIEKKNPGLILHALQQIGPRERNRFKIVFVGSGKLEEQLRSMAQPLAAQVQFPGFVNQSKITDYYLASDILVLPSRQAGETWGLVVNEALQAGCGVVMTKAVGCHREFGAWERVRVIDNEDAAACARALEELARFPRSFDWCEVEMRRYSVAAAAEAILRQVEKIEQAQ
jgi:glycosyltransferase involved in cell wall biosynthesis